MHKLRQFLFLLFLLCLNSAVVAKPEANQSVLPLKFDTGNLAPYGLPSTVINIAGKEYPVIFDIGAKKYALALTKKALEGIQVHFTGKKICSTSVRGKDCLDEFIVPEVQLGAFTVKNVKGVVLDNSKLWGGNGQDFKETEASQIGLMGFPLLSEFNLLLDYPHAKLIVVKSGAKPTDYPVDQWISIPFQGHLLTKLNFDNKPILLSWDTGALPSVIKESFANSILKKPCPTDAPYAKKECSSIQSTSFSTTERKQLPNIWFKTINTLPPIAPFDGLVGSNFYADNMIYFDFDQKVIFVKPH